MRTKLPNRRNCIISKVQHVNASGTTEEYLITVGFDHDEHIKEVFCAQNMYLKGGSDMHGVITDACILLSIYLQTGGEPEKLIRSMTETRGLDNSSGAPTSVIGAIAKTILQIQQELLEKSK